MPAATSEKIVFENHEGLSLAGRLERPAGRPLAYAIFAHCFTCSKDIAAATRVSRALAARGYAVLRFDFTGLGNSDGDFANTDFSSNVADLVAAADHLREHFAAPRLLVGHSLGGAAVLMAAPRIPEVVAAATIGAPSTPLHVRKLLAEGVPAIEAQGAADVVLAGRTFRIEKSFLDDLEQHDLPGELRDLGAALLIMHSPRDEIVGVDEARQLFEAAWHPKSFVSLDQADHLLSRKEDGEYVAAVLSAWASRYVQAETADDGLPAGAPGVVEVVEQPVRHAQRIVAGRHVLAADEPVSVGGGDTGPTPYDYLLAGLGACTSMTLRMYADHKGWPLEGVAVTLGHDRIHAKDCDDCEKQDGMVDRIARTVRVEGPLDEAQRARLLEIADRCPVHRTLENEIKIETELAT